jgi:hypothetical protein
MGMFDVLKNGDTEGALTHLNAADQGVSDQSAKMRDDNVWPHSIAAIISGSHAA